MTKNSHIKVLVADDHEMVRIGLKTYFKSRKDRFVLIGEAVNGTEAVAFCEQSQPDVLLMDLLMPKKNGLTATTEIHVRWPEIKIIVMTGFSEVVSTEELLRAGAVGVISKSIAASEMDEAIQAAYAGRLVLDEVNSQNLLDSLSSSQKVLSEREYEVLEILCDGLTNQQMAEKLHISETTVKTHVSSVLRKLKAANRTAAIATAVRQRLLQKWHTSKSIKVDGT